MNQHRAGRAAVAGVALASIVIPVLVDGVLLGSAHMQNPLWLPHARLHGAMSFHDSIALGAGALVLVARHRRRRDRGDLALAAFLAAAPWAALLLARLWPGTSYRFAGDPAFAGQAAPVVLGVPVEPNVVLAVALVLVAAVGYAVGRGRVPATPAAPPRRPRVPVDVR